METAMLKHRSDLWVQGHPPLLHSHCPGAWVSTHELMCTMDISSWSPWGEVCTWVPERQEGKSRIMLRWHNICPYFGLFWTLWKVGISPCFLERFCEFLSTGGATFFPATWLCLQCCTPEGCGETVAGLHAHGEWESWREQTAITLTLRQGQPCCFLVPILPSNNLQKQSHKPSGVSRSSWAHEDFEERQKEPALRRWG